MNTPAIQLCARDDEHDFALSADRRGQPEQASALVDLLIAALLIKLRGHAGELSFILLPLGWMVTAALKPAGEVTAIAGRANALFGFADQR